MAGAHQKLNGSRDLTTPLSGMICQPAGYLPTTFEVSISAHYEYTKRVYKIGKWGCMG